MGERHAPLSPSRRSRLGPPLTRDSRASHTLLAGCGTDLRTVVLAQHHSEERARDERRSDAGTEPAQKEPALHVQQRARLRSLVEPASALRRLLRSAIFV